jgi:hypothetical protein
VAVEQAAITNAVAAIMLRHLVASKFIKNPPQLKAGVMLRDGAGVVGACYMGSDAMGKTPPRDLKRISLAWR